MSLTTSEMTPADIAAVTRNNDGNNGYGDNGAWWIIILFLFAFCGWGGNGFGGFGGGSGALTRADLCQDMNFSQLENGVRGIQQGICDSTFALNNSINAASAATQQGFTQAELSRCNQQAALMQMLYTMSANQAQCCCETRAAIADVNYNIAAQSCDTRNTIQSATRDIIDNQNSNARALLDKLTQQELAAKDAQIAAQNQRIFGLELSASQQAQNNYLVNTLRPCPVPSYITCNPWAAQAPYGSCGACGCSC